MVFSLYFQSVTITIENLTKNNRKNHLAIEENKFCKTSLYIKIQKRIWALGTQILFPLNKGLQA
ncbi:MAG: hypothetical protein PG977_000812 [Bartonella clarridgeiae]|nr:MAG: hypothetical protein PG977_000812 [Bartonella clarridgeiae]